MITNPTDIKDLLAFIGALSQQESPLPDGIQQEIEQAISNLENNPKTAIDNLRKIAKFEPLHKLYTEARGNLTGEHIKQKRSKVIHFTLEKQPISDLENPEVKNISLSADVLSVKGAKQFKEQVINQAIQTSSDNSSAQPSAQHWSQWLLNYLFAV